MRIVYIAIVPIVLIGGLLWGANYLYSLSPKSSECALGTCRPVIYDDDTGDIFNYPFGTRFSVEFDRRKNPEGALRCTPDGIINAVETISQIEGPGYTTRFETLRTGTCILTNDHFSATINVIQRPVY